MDCPFDNAVIHCYPGSPYIAKCAVNFRKGDKIVMRIVMKDRCAAVNYIVSHKMLIPFKTRVHKIET